MLTNTTRIPEHRSGSINRILQLFLTESPIVSSDALELGQKTSYNLERMADRYREANASYKLLQKKDIDGFSYEMYFHKNSGIFRVFCLDGDELVGHLSSSYRNEPFIKNTPEIQKYPQVMLVSSFVQNRNIGTNLYNILISYTGGIISDLSLTPASYGLWRKLSRTYHVYHIELDVNGEEIENVEKLSTDDFTAKRSIGDVSTLFVASKSEIFENSLVKEQLRSIFKS